MASGQTPRRRNPESPAEPVTGKPEDPNPASESSGAASGGEPPTGPASAHTRAARKSAAQNRALGEVATRRVAAAAAAAAAVASEDSAPASLAASPSAPPVTAPDGVSDPEHFPIPETEEPASSSSAAAAAAAAAVAAVSAAIAATAAANGSRVSEAPATLAEPAPPAAPPPPAETAQPAMPARPPVTVQGYVRPPGIDVPGLTRAHHDDEDAASPAPGSPPLAPAALAAPAGDVPGIVRAGEPGGEPAAPVVAPLFSNEGIVRGQKAARAGRRSRALGPVAGVSEALTAARDALGHDANPPRSPAESSPDGSGSVAVGDAGPAATAVATSAAAVASTASSAVAAPAAAADLPPGDSASGTRIPHSLSHFGDSTLFAWIATGVLAVRVAAAWIGAALAAVLLPVAGALGRLVSAPFRPVADWLRARDSELPEFDDYGYPRQPRVARRRAAGAVIFVGFFGIIFLGIALAAALPPVPATIAASATPGSSAMAVAPSNSAPGLTSTSERAGRGDRDADSSRGRDRKPHRGSDSGPHRGSDREAHSQADSEADSQADSETHPQTRPGRARDTGAGHHRSADARRHPRADGVAGQSCAQRRPGSAGPRGPHERHLLGAIHPRRVVLPHADVHPRRHAASLADPEYAGEEHFLCDRCRRLERTRALGQVGAVRHLHDHGDVHSVRGLGDDLPGHLGHVAVANRSSRPPQ